MLISFFEACRSVFRIHVKTMRIRIRIGRFGSGSYSLKIPSVFFIPLFGSLVNTSPFYFYKNIIIKNLFYSFEIIDKID